MILAIIILIVGILSRFVLHIPNFTPVLALALFAGIYLKGQKAYVIPLAMMIISDLFIGFHPTIFFTWGSLLLIVAIGQANKGQTLTRTLFGSLAAAGCFFIITNFGVWLMTDMYGKSLSGFVECFILAIPFFRFTLVSTLMYTLVFSLCYELLAERLKATRLAVLIQH